MNSNFFLTDKDKKDLRYWSDKLKYAQEKLYGEKGLNMQKVCRMMLDLYLDRIQKISIIK